MLAAIGLTAAPLHAQGEIEAFGGVLAPTTTFNIPAREVPSVYGPTQAKFTTAFTYGAAGRVWVAPRLGLQATIGFAGGSLLVQPPFGSSPDTSYASSSTALTIAFLYRLSTPTIPNAVWLSAGPLWINQESPRLDGIDGTSSLGLAFGAGSSLPISDRIRVSLGLDLFLYSLNLSSPSDAPIGSTQLDFRALAGMSYHIGHDPE
ncbi:MAG TPA: hypothetical protein PKA66_13670 [Gemmatimonadales bacterium]|nr:hypothetical protein [Gemmatimonadales bacterium]